MGNPRNDKRLRGLDRAHLAVTRDGGLSFSRSVPNLHRPQVRSLCVGGWSQGIESKDNLPRGWWHLLSLVVQRLTGAWGFHQEMDGARRSFEVELSYELDPEARELADLISQAPSVLSLGARIQPRRQHLVERCPNPRPGFQLSAASGCHKAHPFVDAGCTGSVGQWDGRWYSHRLCDASSNCHPRETDGALVCRSSSVMQPTCIL